jgi:deoxyribonuclease IV
VVHAPHLINLGSPVPLVAERSSALLAAVMRRAARLGATAVVFHAGSSLTAQYRARALRQVRHATARLLAQAPTGVDLLVEPTAGGGAALASTIETTAEYLDAIDERLGLCLDTCHLHATGHDLSAAMGMRRAITQLKRSIRPNRLRLIHVNDSRDLPGSRRDRHESLGRGTIGADALSTLVRMRGLADVPLLVDGRR